MVIHAKQQRESNGTQSAGPIETANRRKRRRTSGEARERQSHIRPVGLRENTLQHFRRNTRNRQLRCNKGKCLSASKRSKFEHRFPTPFLRSLMPRTCERVSSAGMMNAPSSSPSGKRTLSWSANSLHKGANCFPSSRSSIDLD